MDGNAQPRRSLVLAGGGTKVAFQAGVLQVLLDEAEQRFDHVDAASGGVLNLVMLCQGLTGTQVADNWRAYRPLRAIEPNLGQWLVLPFATSLFRLGRFRRNVLAKWGLDWDVIRRTELPATFNLYNFTDHEHLVLEAAAMSEDKLISAVSLPMWFPPVNVDSKAYIDAVFVTDGNIEEAVRRRADEIWVIWTVSRRGRWGRGLVAQYFQMIEAMANAQFNAILERIDQSNEALACGRHSEFERPIKVRVLRAEVPLHYLLNFTHDRVRTAVELGVQAGRRWCADEGLPLRAPHPERHSMNRRGVRFSEEMSGWVGMGMDDFTAGAERGRIEGTSLGFRLDIEVDDLDQFIVRPAHQARACGVIVCDALGGELAIERGVFNLFVDHDDPSDKRMLYRLWFRDGAGHPLTLDGYKAVQNDRGPDLWSDTTTLFARVLDGHTADTEEVSAVAAGILRISVRQFARQLTTFRADAPTRWERVQALGRFGRLFIGGLWDVYGREVIYDQR